MGLFKKVMDALDPFGKEEADQNQQRTDMAETYADITVLLDRSNSMITMQNDVVEAYNERVMALRKTPGNNKWTLIQFDDYNSANGAVEPFPLTTYSQVDEKNVPTMHLKPATYIHPIVTNTEPKAENCVPVSGSVAFQPRGGTALVDAMCKTVLDIEARLSGQFDKVKPIVMVITDGEENSSREYTTEKLREITARTQGKGFEFLYLGANQDSFHQARLYGFQDNIGAYSAGISALSGGMAGSVSGQYAHSNTAVNNFAATGQGIRQAITSGFMGMASVVSGSVASGCVGSLTARAEYQQQKMNMISTQGSQN